MEQYKIGCAVVRVHGSTDRDRLKAATEKFLKKAENQRKKRTPENKTK